MRLSGLKTSKKSPEEIPKKDELEDQTLEEPNFNDEKDDQFDSPPIDFPRKPSIPTLYDSAKDFAESFFKDDSNSIYDEFPTHMDTRETQYHYIVNLVVPGVAVEDIKVEVVHGVLMISGEIKKDPEEKNYNMVKQERKYGKFGRSIKLPKNIFPNAIKASLQQGVLTVFIEKDLLE